MKPLDHVVDIILAFLILFLFPLLYLGLKQDSIIITKTSTDTVNLVDDVRSKGYLTKDMYEQYLNQLSETGLLYNITMKHRQLIYEPEYRFRTAEEIIESQNTAYAGTNEYHYYPISTEKPAVSDPVNTGNLNTDTNESIMAAAVNTPALADHIHTSDCYTGHRHAESGCMLSGDMTKQVILNTDASWVGNGTEIFVDVYCATCGREILHAQGTKREGWGGYYSYLNISYNHFSSTGEIITTYVNTPAPTDWCLPAPAGIERVENFIDSFTVANAYGVRPMDWQFGTIPLGFDVTKNMPWLGCPYCGAFGSNYSCGLTEDTTVDCSQVVTSINATHPIQTVARGDSLITTVIATYLDGSTKTIVCTASGYDSSKIGTQTVTLTYAGLVDTAKVSGTKTCPITVTVIPKTKTCINGHTYNLNTDGTDPGCPYCKAWLKSLSISVPDTKTLTIYRGTTLEENGVSLFATYLDGSTEYVTDAYVDNLDKTYIGSQNVTISYKGLSVGLTVITKRNIVLCPICGRYYELYPDDTDPGCPYCAALTPIFTGNVMQYYDEKYTDEIVKELYEGSGIYYFTQEDYFIISVHNYSRSLGGKLTASIYKYLADGNIQIENGGYIRENGQ